MSAQRDLAADPPSPCISACRVNPELQLCEGCFRTLDEIATWAGLSPHDRYAVLARLPARRPRA